jgi:ribulose kinase
MDEEGNILSESTYATTTYRCEHDARIFEQSTSEIWHSITSAVKDVVKEAKLKPEDVKGMGFDATCSLAVTDWDGNAMSVTPEPEGKWGKGDRNIVLWADHRAEQEANEINASGSMVLNYVGKTMSVSVVP